ncbi:acetate--CoA ligase [Gordonia sp. HNM0687]|uniref:acetate--CoA ligase n=1 Tax=Gordonia mangrovi TaxID=2665643 RepID=A0A6L7GQU2_9ACTN|nr:acetate--CoA ligase [Gordonia mangrovi]MXP22309.1 acetate--CoA ligase [Gordonia mangrovi]UVF77796.1 acetate--CoA ligase [Gordonia mangrovi]
MEVIHKTDDDLRIPPNLADYDASRRDFSWARAADGLLMPGGGCNIAYSAVDRHVGGPTGTTTALRFLGDTGPDGNITARDVSYDELATLARRFTNVLRRLGIGKGDTMFVVSPRIPELYAGVLGALRNGTVVSPLFSAFGPEPIAMRVQLGGGSVLLTTKSLYRRKIAKMRAEMPTLRHVLLVDESGAPTDIPGTEDLRALMADASDDAEITETTADDPALLHFTSGTTGTPKGAVHVHGAVTTHYTTGLYALDLHPDDTFWCTADPGWVTGTSYGIIAPLLHGVTSIIDPADFDAERWYRILEQQDVSVWYTAPTAIRMLMKAGSELAHKFPRPHLRFIASVGEPLNPEAVLWGRDVLGLPIHDNWWQTETGGIMIANTPAFDIKPGSMGRPLPGIDAVLVRHNPDHSVTVIDTPDDEGELALRVGWPSMFRAYLNNEERYHKCFVDDLYLSGDLAKRDEDGYFWFVGRADDVIKSAGHLIGPFEVENVLMEHPAVAEAAVIGTPDPIVGEVVKAFVTLRRGYEFDDKLRRELLGHARKKLGAAVAPKEIDHATHLPHTRSGKIMRRLLKARELGLPEGDISTLESGS